VLFGTDRCSTWFVALDQTETRAEGSMAKYIIEINGYKLFRDTRSDHQKYGVPSAELDVTQRCLLHTLSVFHEYSVKNDIVYSLSYGSLIGYHCNRMMLPWDDDIDITVKPEDFKKLNLLYESGTPTQSREYRRGIKDISSKVIILNNERFEIIRHPTATTPRFFKLKPEGHDSFSGDVGGLDISTAIVADGRVVDSLDLRSPTIDFSRFNASDFPETSFNGVRTRALDYGPSKKILDERYGPGWVIMEHPNVKYFIGSSNSLVVRLGRIRYIRKLARSCRKVLNEIKGVSGR
jgi:hypothetical protein